ncbi:hypothetical protein [Phytohabitans kaempferiae]|uniref:Uncharacterized protein n=1 Tax=Phytohabitans kaempferiae TaxID=1620943 RepID=A0ABV6MCA5_9ACTN
MDIAEISTVATAVMTVALIGIAGFVGLGIYRARHSTAREAEYRALAERVMTAQTEAADAARSTATEMSAVRAELAQVKQRLAALESLLSQIG